MRLVMLSILNVGALVFGCTNAPPEGPDLSATVAASVQATIEVHQAVSPNPTPIPPAPTGTPAAVPTQTQSPAETPAPVATPTQQVYGLPTDAWKTPTPIPTPKYRGEQAREYYDERYNRWRDAGKTHEQAVSLANDYVEARIRGDSHEVGVIYALAIEEGLSEQSARAAGDKYSSELDRLLNNGVSHEDANDRALESVAIYMIAEKAGYSDDVARSYALAYFTLKDAGVPRGDALAVARTYASTVMTAMEAGFSHEDAVELSQYVIEAAGLMYPSQTPVPLSDEIQPSEPAIEVSLRELVNDYLTNAVRADVKYESLFLVSGRITEIGSTGRRLARCRWFQSCRSAGDRQDGASLI